MQPKWCLKHLLLCNYARLLMQCGPSARPCMCGGAAQRMQVQGVTAHQAGPVGSALQDPHWAGWLAHHPHWAGLHAPPPLLCCRQTSKETRFPLLLSPLLLLHCFSLSLLLLLQVLQAELAPPPPLLLVLRMRRPPWKPWAPPHLLLGLFPLTLAQALAPQQQLLRVRAQASLVRWPPPRRLG